MTGAGSVLCARTLRIFLEAFPMCRVGWKSSVSLEIHFLHTPVFVCGCLCSQAVTSVNKSSRNPETLCVMKHSCWSIHRCTRNEYKVCGDFKCCCCWRLGCRGSSSVQTRVPVRVDHCSEAFLWFAYFRMLAVL